MVAGVRGLPGDDPRATSGSTATLFYDLRDVVGKSGFGIGSAGLPAYNLLVEGYSQALDNDVVLSMKQANIPAVSRFVDTGDGRRLLRARGAPHRRQPAGAAGAHRPAARATPASTASGTSSPRSRRTRSTWTGASSPSPTRSRAVVDLLGRATAKIHCASDEDSEQDLVDFQVEEAIAASVRGPPPGVHRLADRLRHRLRRRVRDDHALFVDAFREGRIGVSAT